MSNFDHFNFVDFDFNGLRKLSKSFVFALGDALPCFDALELLGSGKECFRTSPAFPKLLSPIWPCPLGEDGGVGPGQDSVLEFCCNFPLSLLVQPDFIWASLFIIGDLPDFGFTASSGSLKSEKQCYSTSQQFSAPSRASSASLHKTITYAHFPS